jgi:homoserine O-acetyltransferase
MLPGHPEVAVVESIAGHDGFLLETAQVGRIVRDALELSY